MNWREYPRHSVEFSGREFFAGLRVALGLSGEDRRGLVADFESEFARFIGTRYAVALPSCRFGIYHYLRQALPVGSEVLVPAYTFSAVASAVRAAGMVPVFVDAEKGGFNLDVSALERKLTPRTRAIVVSHLYGKPCAMEQVLAFARKAELKVIEDCAHACGSTDGGRRLGSLGEAGFFSFGVGKNLGTAGGGMLTTDDPEVHNRFRALVSALPEPSPIRLASKLLAARLQAALTQPPLFSLLTFPLIRWLSRADINWLDARLNEKPASDEEFLASLGASRRYAGAQAAVGLRKLRSLEAINARQSRQAAQFDAQIHPALRLGCGPSPGAGQRAVPYYVVMSKQRDALRRRLLARGVDTKACDMSNCAGAEGPNAQELFDFLLEIPNSPWLSEQDLGYIAESVNREYDALIEARG